MTIHLPKEIESSLAAEIDGGRFATIEEALAEAWRCYQRDHLTRKSAKASGLGSIGAMRDAADELDVIVADAMKRRGAETWRELSLE